MADTKNNSGSKQPTFARDLGLFDATMLGIGAMIGAGIFVLTGLNDAVERLITISQLDTVLNIAGSMDEAANLITESES